MALLGDLQVLAWKSKKQHLVTLLGGCKIQGELLGCLLLERSSCKRCAFP